MISSPYSAEDWPIAAAMMAFGNKDSTVARSTTPNLRNGPSTCGSCGTSASPK